MTRKVITIDFSKCPYFKSGIIRLAGRFDFEGKILWSGVGAYGLKGDMSKFIDTLISLDKEAGLEFFGKSYVYDSEVAKQVDYLTDLIYGEG